MGKGAPSYVVSDCIAVFSNVTLVEC